MTHPAAHLATTRGSLRPSREAGLHLFARAGLAGVLCSIALSAGAASAYVRTTTQSSNPPCPGGQAKPLFWRASNLPYAIDAAGSADVTGEAAFTAVQTSFQAWQELICPNFSNQKSYLRFTYQGKVQDAAVGFDQNGANQNVVKWIQTGWTQSARAIAVTLTTYDCNSGEIYDADITLNGEGFHFSAEDVGRLGKADVQNTVTHEAGHFIGFDHDLDPNSTMYADAPLGEIKKRTLEATNIEGACTVYAPNQAPCPTTTLGRCAQKGGCDAAGGDASALAVGLVLALALLRPRRRVRIASTLGA